MHVFNHSKRAIEFDAFHGVPFTHLELKTAAGYERGQGGRCGNGFAPRLLRPGGYEAFPLWGPGHHGPGRSDSYRVVLPYAVVAGKKRVRHEAVSEGFRIHYGDVRPRTWTSALRGGPTVLVGMHTDPVDKKNTQSHTSASLARSFLPGVNRCIAAAQKIRPWLRGRFSLVVYRYPSSAKTTTFVTASLLGTARVNACIQAIAAPAQFLGKHQLTFAVSAPVAGP